jgi:hypothetical protein
MCRGVSSGTCSVVSRMKKRIKKELVLTSLSEAIEGAVIGVLLGDKILRKLIGEAEEIPQAVLKGWQELENAVKIVFILEIIQSREGQGEMDREEKERLEGPEDGDGKGLKGNFE